MFAIIAIGGKQYKVHPGDLVTVDEIAGKSGDTVTFNEVLLVSDDKKTKVGTPTIKKMSVTAKIVGHEKGEKIDVLRFKSKVRYRRARGFRARLTKLEILAITKV